MDLCKKKTETETDMRLGLKILNTAVLSILCIAMQDWEQKYVDDSIYLTFQLLPSLFHSILDLIPLLSLKHFNLE